MTPLELVSRLRACAPRLAELIVEDALVTPVAAFIGPAQDFVEAVVAAIAAADAVEETIVRRSAALIAALPDGRLCDAAPGALLKGAEEIAALPYRVPRVLMVRVLSRGPVRQLLRAQILRTLVEFARRATAPITENAVARGLSRLAFGNRDKPTALGSIRSAFSGEAERRAADFADTAVDEVIAGIAEQLADPAKAREQAAIRVAFLEALLEETGRELAGVAQPQLAAAVAAARRALAAWSPGVRDDLAAAITRVVGEEAARPTGELLAELGVREVVAEHARRLVAARIAALTETGPFAQWLAELME